MPRVSVRAPWSRHVRPANLYGASQPAGQAACPVARLSAAAVANGAMRSDGLERDVAGDARRATATRVAALTGSGRPAARGAGRGGGATSPRHSAIALGLGANARAAPGRERMRCAGPGRRHVRAHGFLAGSSFNQQWLTAELGHPGRIRTFPYLFTHGPSETLVFG